MTSENSENEILVTGSKFLGVSGVKGTSSVVEKIMSENIDELQILAYDITTNAVEFLDLLRSAIKGGVKTTMIYNTPKGDQMKQKSRVDAINELESLSSKYNNFIFVPFPVDGKILHAKVVIANRKKAYVGSSNFTWGGMSKNYEVGMVVGEDDSYTLSKLVDSLLPRVL
ncbi:MAG: hypothetical protein HOL90_02825 [Candidatus Nitrosopelagicus sp.]|jgi:phosphatidylserine/phosphatidylglycerophosphate/cardiolipin synthase-like enzyme|nr:hypothetical protein [Candidatus Nitrosopelagicus sp.]